MGSNHSKRDIVVLFSETSSRDYVCSYLFPISLSLCNQNRKRPNQGMCDARYRELRSKDSYLRERVSAASYGYGERTLEPSRLVEERNVKFLTVAIQFQKASFTSQNISSLLHPNILEIPNDL